MRRPGTDTEAQGEEGYINADPRGWIQPAGRVDAVLLQPPFTVKARQEGLNELAFLSDLGLDYLGTCLAATRQTIQRKEDITRRFVGAFMEGVVFYKTQKEASIQSISKFTKLKDRPALEEAYNTYAIKFMPRIPYPSIKGVETILEDLGKTNPKARGADPRRFRRTAFPERSRREGCHSTTLSPLDSKYLSRGERCQPKRCSAARL